MKNCKHIKEITDEELKQKEEAIFRLNNYILEINRSDEGWDFTLYDDLKEIDGGQLDDPEIDIIEARDTIINDFIDIISLKGIKPIFIEIQEENND